MWLVLSRFSEESFTPFSLRRFLLFWNGLLLAWTLAWTSAWHVLLLSSDYGFCATPICTIKLATRGSERSPSNGGAVFR